MMNTNKTIIENNYDNSYLLKITKNINTYKTPKKIIDFINKEIIKLILIDCNDYKNL